VASQLAVRRGGTVHPLLLVSRHDDLLGAVIAHEIGHVLGLRHGTGLMRARLDPRDVVALRLGSLAFAPVDAARLRTSVAALGREPERATGQIAGRR
jgi:predicted Zn-dependent protease